MPTDFPENDAIHAALHNKSAVFYFRPVNSIVYVPQIVILSCCIA